MVPYDAIFRPIIPRNRSMTQHWLSGFCAESRWLPVKKIKVAYFSDPGLCGFHVIRFFSIFKYSKPRL